jgi:protein gp37
MADLFGKWVPEGWINAVMDACGAAPDWEYLFLTKFPSRYNKVTFPPGAWVGTSVDEQRRVPLAEKAFAQLRGVKVRWLSLEPLRAPLQFSDMSMFDWVVIGAQTQANNEPALAPPMDWVVNLMAQARDAGCKLYLKPNLLGETNPQSPGMVLPQEEP